MSRPPSSLIIRAVWRGNGLGVVKKKKKKTTLLADVTPVLDSSCTAAGASSASVCRPRCATLPRHTNIYCLSFSEGDTTESADDTAARPPVFTPPPHPPVRPPLLCLKLWGPVTIIHIQIILQQIYRQEFSTVLCSGIHQKPQCPLLSYRCQFVQKCIIYFCTGLRSLRCEYIDTSVQKQK